MKIKLNRDIFGPPEMSGVAGQVMDFPEEIAGALIAADVAELVASPVDDAPAPLVVEVAATKKDQEVASMAPRYVKKRRGKK